MHLCKLRIVDWGFASLSGNIGDNNHLASEEKEHKKHQNKKQIKTNKCYVAENFKAFFALIELNRLHLLDGYIKDNLLKV